MRAQVSRSKSDKNSGSRRCCAAGSCQGCFVVDLFTSPMDCHLNVVGRFEFSMILRATPSVVFNHFHQGHPWR